MYNQDYFHVFCNLYHSNYLLLCHISLIRDNIDYDSNYFIVSLLFVSIFFSQQYPFLELFKTFFCLYYLYSSNSKVLRYFYNPRHSAADTDAFEKLVKMMHLTGLRDTKIALHFSSANHRICRYDIEHSLGIHSF